MSWRRKSGKGPNGRPNSAAIRLPDAIPELTRNLRTRLSSITGLMPVSSKSETALGTKGFFPFASAFDDMAPKTEGAEMPINAISNS